MMFFKKRFLKKVYLKPHQCPSKRSGIAIPLIVRGETDILGEWIEHNLALDVEHFIAYDDGSPPETQRIIEAKLNDSQYTIIPWSMKLAMDPASLSVHPQVLAFAHAILNFRDRFRHFAFIDPDEFIVPKTDLSLCDALERLGNYPNISLPWHMFGGNGYRTRPPGDAGTAFIRRKREILSDDGTCQFKCIVDPCAIKMVSVHRFETHEFGDVSMNDIGITAQNAKRLSKDFISSARLQLNHYYTRSDEELRSKIRRGQNEDRKIAPDGGHIMKRAIAIEKDTVIDTSPPDFRDRLRKSNPAQKAAA